MEVSQIAKEIPEVDYLRLLIVYFSCYEMGPNDKETMLKSLPEDKQRLALKNIEFLDETLADRGKNNFKRRWKE